MVPEMGAKPGPAGIGCTPRRMLARSSIIPHIGHHMQHPALCLTSVETLGALLSGRNQPFHHGHQRLDKLTQTDLLHRPIVHLDIYIRVIITVPRRARTVRPQPLKIRRKRPRPRTAYEKVTPIVPVQCRKSRSQTPAVRRGSFPEPFISRQCIIVALLKINPCPSVKLAMRSYVAGNQFVIILMNRRVKQAVAETHIPLAGKYGPLRRIRSRGRNDQCSFARSCQCYGPVAVHGLAVRRGDRHRYLIAYAFLAWNAALKTALKRGCMRLPASAFLVLNPCSSIFLPAQHRLE